MVAFKTFIGIITLVFLSIMCDNGRNNIVVDPEWKTQSSTPIIVYSVIFEWGASIYMIENGINRSLFNSDTIYRTMPSLDPSSGRLVYLKNAALFPLAGFSGWPSVSVGDVTSENEKTVLKSDSGIYYLSPEWDGNSNIVVYRQMNSTLELLVVKEDGQIKQQKTLGKSSVTGYPAIYAIPGKKGFVLLWWEDTTAIFEASTGTFHGKAAGGAIRSQPFVCMDSLFIQCSYGKPKYRVYSLSTLMPTDRYFNVSIAFPSTGSIVRIDSAQIAWMNESHRIIYDKSGEKMMVYLCDDDWNALDAQQGANIEWFLPFSKEKEIYCVVEGGDQYGVLKYKLDPAGLEGGYEIMTDFEPDYFILDARIYP